MELSDCYFNWLKSISPPVLTFLFSYVEFKDKTQTNMVLNLHTNYSLLINFLLVRVWEREEGIGSVT